VKDTDGSSEAAAEGPASENGEESVDSLMRRVAHVSTLDMPRRSTIESPDVQAAAATLLAFPPPLPRVGDLLGGRYELTEMLGTGGMGAVFAAKHKGTGREVAIKVLLPQGGSGRHKQERVARFVREASAAGRIRHLNVVDVYDVDGDSDTPYIVMERLHGESLWQRIKRGALPTEEAVGIMIAAMRGVAEVHRQGVVHRDLKPDNIYLARATEGAPLVPKVLDFGVSRIITRQGTEPRPTTLTRAGYILGTPSYMPLEQLRGEPDIDARSDVYALGVILYEALCGERPYEARNDHELVIRMATEKPTPLRQRAPHIDTSLARIVTLALARDPSDRFQDVEAFAGALERWLAGERTADVEPPPPNTPSQPARDARTQTLRRSGLLVVALAIAAAAGALLSMGARQEAEPIVSQPTQSAPFSIPAPRIAPVVQGAPTQPSNIATPDIAAVPAPVPAQPATESAKATPPPPPVSNRPKPGTKLTRELAPENAPAEPHEDRATKLKPDDF